MTNAEMLMSLRLGDTAFPSGGFAFSSGLENSIRDGFVVDEDGVREFTTELLLSRWNTMDRSILRSAWPGGPTLARADRRAEAHAVMSVMRDASKWAGSALLGTFSTLGYAEVADYRFTVQQGQAPGHLPVAQALCYRNAGLSLKAAELVSGWQLVSGIAGAAIRLGVVGHLGAQRVLGHVESVLACVLDADDGGSELSSFSAFAEIAAHRTGNGARLFAS